MYKNTFNDVYFPCVKSYTKKIDIRLIPMKLRTYKSCIIRLFVTTISKLNLILSAIHY